MAVETEDKKKQDLPDHLKIEVATNKVRTRGWEKFDKWVHFGIGFGLNVALALTQSIFQINWGLNKKIDAAKTIKGLNDKGEITEALKMADLEAHQLDGFVNANKRFSPKFLDGYFKFAEKVKYNFTDKIFGVKRDKYGKGQEGSDRPFFSDVAADVLVLANPGHITTAMVQFFEQPWLKPKLVRWFDKREDAKRIAKGETITEEELAERDAIYKKLDTDLAGKSFIQMWTARLVGIAVVIGSLIGFGMADRKLTGAKLEGEAGLYRVGKLFTQTGRFVRGGLEGIEVESPGWLKDATSRTRNNPNSVFSSRMLALVGTEVAGSGITAATQYATLMFKEFFTDKYKDAKKEAKAEAKSHTHENHETHERLNKKSIVHVKSDDQPEQSAPHASEEKKATSKIKPRQQAVEKSADYKEVVERTRNDAALHAMAGA